MIKGFEQIPLINIEFNRMPREDLVLLVYAADSGVSAYGTPTKFKYIVTNLARDRVAREGLLRTSDFLPGDYVIRVIAEDYAGSRASREAIELWVTVRN